MSFEPVNVACLGMGWWSDVLADAMVRSGKLKIRSCYTRSDEKRAAFAKKYDCTAAVSYEAILADNFTDFLGPMCCFPFIALKDSPDRRFGLPGPNQVALLKSHMGLRNQQVPQEIRLSILDNLDVRIFHRNYFG